MINPQQPTDRDKEIKDLLKSTLHDIYGIRVWIIPGGTFGVGIGFGASKETTITRKEIEDTITSAKKFIELVHRRIEPLFKEV